MERKWVYNILDIPGYNGIAEWYDDFGDKTKSLFGGKGANIARMKTFGVSVPDTFIITTEACREYYKIGNIFPDGLWEQVVAELKRLEQTTGKSFSGSNPLLVSCRSGAKFSMPGMMDTILNIGLNDTTVENLSKISKNEKFAYDSYRRLIQGFGSIVLGISDDLYEDVIDNYKNKYGLKDDKDFESKDWKYVINEYKEITKREKGFDFPQDPITQIKMSIEAVFQSWNCKRAVDYRNFVKISHDIGTAVSIVEMVFGNLDDNSGTGVAFTRNPITGEKKIYGEFLFNAQGEDVVAGVRNAVKIEALEKNNADCYQKFIFEAQKLEKNFREMQDVEITVEKGKLFFLQTRDGKRTSFAKIKIAVEMAEEGLITKEEAIMRVSDSDIVTLMHPHFDEKALRQAEKDGRLLVTGINASPGSAQGKIYFDADTCSKIAKEKNEKVIMVRRFTKPDDVHGMIASQGILTSEGGATSHAAVVARQFGIPAIVGASKLKIDISSRTVSINDVVFQEGDWFSIDGTTGKVYSGVVPTVEPSIHTNTHLQTLLAWCNEKCSLDGLKVWANADTGKQIEQAIGFGAIAIGLCRTEHQFLAERTEQITKYILSENDTTRKEALNELYTAQVHDFKEIFEALPNHPIVIRLLDPPLHEFLEDLEALACKISALKATGSVDTTLTKKYNVIKSLHESNPMMGLRGVRLLLIHEELAEMQARAIATGAVLAFRTKPVPVPKIMIPLVSISAEFTRLRTIIKKAVTDVLVAENLVGQIPFSIGSMIEVPRACMIADKLGHESEFFSFGTNDLTQMTFGFSRDDVESSFVPVYLQHEIIQESPFKKIDAEGVGELIKIAVSKARSVSPSVSLGVCGEHAGHPESIHFFHCAGMDYVSCSPFRIPIARLAAAHARILFGPLPSHV